MKRPTPEEYEKKLERLARSTSPEHLNDPDFKKTTLMFLAIGGESLARQHIENYGKPFPEKLTLFDKSLEEEVLKDSPDDSDDQSDETDDEESDSD